MLSGVLGFLALVSEAFGLPYAFFLLGVVGVYGDGGIREPERKFQFTSPVTRNNVVDAYWIFVLKIGIPKGYPILCICPSFGLALFFCRIKLVKLSRGDILRSSGVHIGHLGSYCSFFWSKTDLQAR